jgi:hypothetical protein
MIEVSDRSSRSVPRIAVLSSSDNSGTALEIDTRPADGWRAAFFEELSDSKARQRLSRGLAGLGCIHLAAFALCQLIYVPDGRADLRHPLIWFLELVAILSFLRILLGQGWVRCSAAVNLVVKFWTTFLILSFNLVTLNSFTGFELAWYKPAWATLSTFLFATLAWSFNLWLFIPAVQMWATGLLMVKFPHCAFLIYGVSWWISLMGLALWIRPGKQPSNV